MKIFISADIEGVTGVTSWDETDLEKAEWQAARQQMTAEVAAACQGALDAGATEIWVKDSHDSGRNLLAAGLPQEVKLVRGWSGHPLKTLHGLDDTFAAVLLIGYHAGAGSGRNPLEHTWSGNLMCMKLNGRYQSEFSLDAYAAAHVGVPVVFISGDGGVCDEARELIPHIGAVAVKEGAGNATISIHPELAVARIRAGAAQALAGDLALCRLPMPEHFALDVRYRRHTTAYQYGFFPGARQTDLFTVRFESDSYEEVLRFLLFAV